MLQQLLNRLTLNGDYYINITDGTCNWTGVGKEITENDRLVYNSGTSSWDHYLGTGGSDFWFEENDVLSPTNANASVVVGNPVLRLLLSYLNLELVLHGNMWALLPTPQTMNLTFEVVLLVTIRRWVLV